MIFNKTLIRTIFCFGGLVIFSSSFSNPPSSCTFTPASSNSAGVNTNGFYICQSDALQAPYVPCSNLQQTSQPDLVYCDNVAYYCQSGKQPGVWNSPISQYLLGNDNISCAPNAAQDKAAASAVETYEQNQNN